MLSVLLGMEMVVVFTIWLHICQHHAKTK